MKGSKKSPVNVIVVGGGLAGLSCAYELNNGGCHVQVLEGQDRVGGRVETVRKPFSTTIFAETGAYWINEKHQVTMDYILNKKELGLEWNRAEIPVDENDLLFYIKNTKVQASLKDRFFRWPGAIELSDREKEMGLMTILCSIFCWDEALEDPTAEDWPSKEVVKKYGDMNFIKFLNATRKVRFPWTRNSFSYQPSEGAIELIRPWFNWWDADLTKLSALALVRDAVLCHRQGDACSLIAAYASGNKDPELEHSAKWYTLRTGMDSLPEAFARWLREHGTPVRCRTKVVGIMQDTKSVTATCELPSGRQHELSADYLVSAIPFSTLRKVKVKPAFSDGKRRIISELQYAPVTRYYVECKDKVLDMQGGAGFTDLPIGNLLDMTYTQPNNRGKVIQTFMTRRLEKLTENERREFVLWHLQSVFPGLTESNIESWYVKSWEADPWVAGAYPSFTPKQFVNFNFRDIGRQEGRIYFAGEHTSRYTGWIEGALESGKRAANEILAQFI